MTLNKTQAAAIVEQVAELADVASCKDIDVALYLLASIARSLGVDPTTVPKFVELSAL